MNFLKNFVVENRVAVKVYSCAEHRCSAQLYILLASDSKNRAVVGCTVARSLREVKELARSPHSFFRQASWIACSPSESRSPGSIPG